MNGYIFNFEGGSYSPDGKVAALTDEQIKEHNTKLSSQELEAMKATGRAVLYLFRDKAGQHSVGTWASEPFQRTSVFRARHSRNNWGAPRLDVWFNAAGATWHGVNVGDNDIVRCKRNKA